MTEEYGSSIAFYLISIIYFPILISVVIIELFLIVLPTSEYENKKSRNVSIIWANKIRFKLTELRRNFEETISNKYKIEIEDNKMNIYYKKPFLVKQNYRTKIIHLQFVDELRMKNGILFKHIIIKTNSDNTFLNNRTISLRFISKKKRNKIHNDISNIMVANTL